MIADGEKDCQRDFDSGLGRIGALSSYFILFHFRLLKKCVVRYILIEDVHFI